MSHVVKCTLLQVNHIDHSPEAKEIRHTAWKSNPGFLGLKGGMTTYFLFDTEENANAFAVVHSNDPNVQGGSPTIEVLTLESTGLASSDFIVP